LAKSRLRASKGLEQASATDAETRWDPKCAALAESDRGADRAAVIYTLIGTAKLDGVDPQTWLADILAPEH